MTIAMQELSTAKKCRMTKGIAAFIKEKQNNEIFGIVDCQSKLEINVSVNNLKVF